MNAKLWKKLQAIIYFTLLMVLIYFACIYYDNIIETLKDNPDLVVIATLLSFISQINQAFGYRSLLKSDDKNKISILNLIKTWGLSGLINYLGPQAGVIFRSIHLKNSGIEFKRSFSASIQYAAVSCCLGLLILFLCSPIGLIYKIGGITAISCLGLIFFHQLNWITQRVSNEKIKKPLDALKKPLNASSIFFIAIQYLLLILVYYFLFSKLTEDPKINIIIGTAASVPLSSLIAITPNGIGIIESIILIATHNIENNLELAAKIIAITRLSHIFSCILCCMIPTSKRKKSYLQNNI